MDSAAIALVAKLIGLFRNTESGADGQSFMALQIPGSPTSADDLDFNLAGARAKADRKAAFAAGNNFARLVNVIPGKVGLQWEPSSRLVWEVYKNVIEGASLLSTATSPADERSLFEARKLLFELKASDSKEFRVPFEPTAKYRLYLGYQGSLPSPDMRVEEFRREWEVKGYKNEVETAYATIGRITAASPGLCWGEWRDRLERSKLNAVDHDSTYYDTYVYPEMFFDQAHQENWTKLTVTSGELTELVQKASHIAGEMFNSFRSAASRSDQVSLERMTLELAKVPIIRPWFEPSAIRSRFWDWNRPGMRPLSDGGDSPKGEMIAYATEAIFARNIDIELANAPVRADQAMLTVGPLTMDRASVSGTRVTSSGMQLMGFICERTPKSPNPPVSGVLSVRNMGGFIARFTVEYDLSGKTKVYKSGNFPVLVTREVRIPREAQKISMKIEIMTSVWPEVWSTLKVYDYDEPVTRAYELSGMTGSPCCEEWKPPR